MNRIIVRGLRVLIVLIALGCLLGQTLILPLMAFEAADLYPEVASLAVPYLVAAILAVLCVQVALGALWKLLSMAASDAVFAERAFRWVDVIIASAGVATAMTFGVAIHLLGIVQLGGPGAVLALGGATIGGLAFVLLMVVMRGLLRRATDDRNELAEVV